jgi:hypothetical protein
MRNEARFPAELDRGESKPPLRIGLQDTKLATRRDFRLVVQVAIGGADRVEGNLLFVEKLIHRSRLQIECHAFLAFPDAKRQT